MSATASGGAYGTAATWSPSISSRSSSRSWASWQPNSTLSWELRLRLRLTGEVRTSLELRHAFQQKAAAQSGLGKSRVAKEILAREDRAGMLFDPRFGQAAQADDVLERRAELSGSQFHAGRDEARRPR